MTSKVLLMTIALALTACGGGESGPDQDEAEAPAVSADKQARIDARSRLEHRPGERAPSPASEGQAVVGEVPESLLARIVADAAQRTGVEPEQIKVTRAESLIWSDGSLGCAKPDEVYTQATVPGYWVVLDAAGKVMDYRATEQGAFRLCEGMVLPGSRESR